MTEDHTYKPGDVVRIKRDTSMSTEWWDEEIVILETDPNDYADIRFRTTDGKKGGEFLMFSEVHPSVEGCNHNTPIWHDEREEYFCPFCES